MTLHVAKLTETATCKNCTETMLRYKVYPQSTGSGVRFREHTFCSAECWNEFQQKQYADRHSEQTHCEQCGREMLKWTKWKNGPGGWKARRFCDDICRGLWRQENVRSTVNAGCFQAGQAWSEETRRKIMATWTPARRERHRARVRGRAGIRPDDAQEAAQLAAQMVASIVAISGGDDGVAVAILAKVDQRFRGGSGPRSRRKWDTEQARIAAQNERRRLARRAKKIAT